MMVDVPNANGSSLLWDHTRIVRVNVSQSSGKRTCPATGESERLGLLRGSIPPFVSMRGESSEYV